MKRTHEASCSTSDNGSNVADNTTNNKFPKLASSTLVNAPDNNDLILAPSTSDNAPDNNASQSIADFIKQNPQLCTLPEEFIKFLVENKKETINNTKGGGFNRTTVPYFQIENGLTCVSSWADEINGILENSNLVLKTQVEREQTYVPENRPPVERIIYQVESLTYYQRELLDTIYAFMDDETELPNLFNCVHVQGKAGCGKTFILSQLSQRTDIDLCYTTITNSLCENIYNLYDVTTSTFCKYIMNLLNLFNYNGFKSLQYAMEQILPEAVLKFDFNVFEGKMKHKWRGLMYKHFIKCRRFIHTPMKVIYLDEYTMISAGFLALFINRLRIKAEYKLEKILLVIAGDSNQIEPFRVTLGHTYNFLEIEADKVIDFVNQMRISDQNYDNVLNNLLIEPNDTIDQFLIDNFEDKCNSDIIYHYPIDTVEPLRRLGNMTLENLERWFADNDTLIKLMFFSYTNLELHFNNMSIATTIYRQLLQLNIKDPEYYIQFQFIRFFCTKTGEFVKNYKTFPALALIRFFPYKLLNEVECKNSNRKLKRGSILYLINWDTKFVHMYSKTTKSMHKLSQHFFHMNLFRGLDLYQYGFPLQLYCADTAHCVEGLTIDRNICINPTQCSKRELYVMLSRVRTAERLHRIYVPRRV